MNSGAKRFLLAAILVAAVVSAFSAQFNRYYLGVVIDIGINVILAVSLNLINGQTLGEAVSSPTSRIAKLVESEKDDKKLIEEIYLSCLNRFPTEKEIEAIDFEHAKSRPELAQDLTWALINSSSFVFNR